MILKPPIACFACAALLGAAPAQTTLYTFTGDAPGDRFGVSVASAGDLNGDGVNDLIIGAQTDDDNGLDSGTARVFSGTDGSVLFNFHGNHASALLGFSVKGAGDVNADGYPDLIAGAFGDDTNGGNAGMARI